MDRHQFEAHRALTAAAKHLNDSRSYDGCCSALQWATPQCTCDCLTSRCGLTAAKSALLQMRPMEDRGAYWFGKPGTNRHERVLALLFAAAVASTERL